VPYIESRQAPIFSLSLHRYLLSRHDPVHYDKECNQFPSALYLRGVDSGRPVSRRGFAGSKLGAYA
jgi:hypothetical protein